MNNFENPNVEAEAPRRFVKSKIAAAVLAFAAFSAAAVMSYDPAAEKERQRENKVYQECLEDRLNSSELARVNQPDTPMPWMNTPITDPRTLDVIDFCFEKSYPTDN